MEIPPLGTSSVATFLETWADTVGGKSVSVGSVSVEDDEGGDTSEKVVRQVPKKEFRWRVALFYFDRMESARADLEQDSFVSTYSPVGFCG